jgi:hypothetical protein
MAVLRHPDGAQVVATVAGIEASARIIIVQGITRIRRTVIRHINHADNLGLIFGVIKFECLTFVAAAAITLAAAIAIIALVTAFAR